METIFHVETEIARVEVGPPPAGEALVRLSRFGGDPDDAFGKELPGLILNRLDVRLPCSDGDEALHKWFQSASFLAPDVGRLIFDLVHWIVGSYCTVDVFSHTDLHRVKKCRCSRRGKSCFPDFGIVIKSTG